MELSSIPIDIIWSVHQSSRISSFKNLTHLDVNSCWELKDVISFSMAKSLTNLQSLFVSECGKVRSIFPDCPQMEVRRLVGLDLAFRSLIPPNILYVIPSGPKLLMI